MNDVFDKRGRRHAVGIDLRLHRGRQRLRGNLKHAMRRGGDRVEHHNRAVVIVERRARVREPIGMSRRVQPGVAVTDGMMIRAGRRLVHMLRRRDRDQSHRERQNDRMRTLEHCPANLRQ